MSDKDPRVCVNEKQYTPPRRRETCAKAPLFSTTVPYLILEGFQSRTAQNGRDVLLLFARTSHCRLMRVVRKKKEKKSWNVSAVLGNNTACLKAVFPEGYFPVWDREEELRQTRDWPFSQGLGFWSRFPNTTSCNSRETLEISLSARGKLFVIVSLGSGSGI